MTAGLDPLRLTAREARRLLVEGELAASELTKTYLDQIERVESRVHAFILVTADNAAKFATEIDQEAGATRGALAGLPTAIKDNMVTESVTTTCGSRILANYQPVYTATAVRRIWDDHIVMLGKSNLDEFAMGSSTENSAFGATHNPWDLGTVPGGSSGGSAAAVAAGEALWALGSDTGGSIRQPAALCGIVGMKPTYGPVSRYGLIAFASSLDQIGPLTRTVDDCALLLHRIAGQRPVRLDLGGAARARSSCPPPSVSTALHFGIPTEYLAAGIEPGVLAALRADCGPDRGARRHLRRDQPAAHRVRPAGLLHHRAGRGEREPRALRRRALRLPLAARRRPHRDVRGHARRGLRRPRSSAAS